MINGQPTTADPGARVLVVFEPTSAGARALREAAELVAQLTVVTLAPQECKRCCGPGAEPYNRALREDATGELHEARRLLGPDAEPVVFRALVGARTPACSKRQLAMPLALWVREHGFDLVVLPRHRLTPGGHYAARKLRCSTGAEVRLVS